MCVCTCINESKAGDEARPYKQQSKAIQHTQGALGVLYCFALLFGYIVTFPKKNELPRAGVILTHDTPHSTSICTCAYIYMYVLHVYISLYTGIMGIH